MALIQITAPTTEPVTVSETKRALNIDYDTDDDYIASLIVAARHAAENYTKRQLRTATWEYSLRNFPGSTGHIELMRPPLTTVSSNVTIQYVDTSSVTQTLSATAYTVNFKRNPGEVYPTYGNDWPTSVQDDHPRAVVITFQSGYASADAVPEPIKQWIIRRVGTMYEYREELTPDRFTALGRDWTLGLLDPFVIKRFAT